MLVERYVVTYAYIYIAIHLFYCHSTWLLLYSESFFNKLKTNPRYLNHKVNRRCDDLIEILLSVEKDVFFERKRKEIVVSISDASKKQEGDRHARGLDIDDSRINKPVSTS